ncbi:MAG TPA: 2TM domain-containing protein [Acidimicrobiales bacterium]|nr:2TM domain-containing protein [Acidimicrobiales bacterium]
MAESAPHTAAPSPERDEARKRLEARRDLFGHVVAYLVINAFLVAVWAFTGAGYFWPGWVLAGWGVGLVFHIWDYFRRPITEADVDAELRRRQR